MSFSSNMPSPQKKSLLDDPNLNSTNEEARPLQYVAGWQRVGIGAWIDAPRNQKSVAQKSGKGGQTTGYKYFSDMMAVVCHGPVDAITHVIMDDTPIWQGVINRGNEQSVTLTLKGKGTMLLFWGRADQNAVPYFTAQGHPAYRGQCYIWFPQLAFGVGRTAAPNVELGIRRVLKVDWLPNIPNNADDANPAVVLADLLTNPIYGLGLDASLFDHAQWQATAAQLAAEDLVFSPILSNAVGVRQLITQICEYFYGYLRWTRNNKLQLGLLRDVPTDLTPLVKLTATHLIEPPEISVAEWSTTFNRTAVVNVDRGTYWQESYSQWYDDGNLALTNQILFQSLERRWITRNSVAATLAMRAGKRFALPNFSASVKARRSAVRTVEIGDWIVLDYDASTYGFAFVLQVTSMKSSGTDTEVIEMELLGQQVTTDPAELYDPNEVIRPPIEPVLGVTALAQWRVVLLPAALAGGLTGNVVAALPVRGDYNTIFANVHDSQDNATYTLMGALGQFASGGTLGAAFPASANSSTAMVVNLLGPDTEMPDTDALSAINDKVLVFLGDEILSVQEVTVVSATQVQLSCLRAQFGTVAANHAAGDKAFVIERRNIQPMLVDALDDDGGLWFKLQSGSLGDLYDLAAVNPQYLQVIPVGSGSGTTTPTATVIGHIKAGGNNAPQQDSPALIYAPSSSFIFTWTQTINYTLFPAGGAGVLNFYDTSNPATRVLQGSFDVTAGALQISLTNAALAGTFDDSIPSTFYVQLTQPGTPSHPTCADCTVNTYGQSSGPEQ